MRFSPSSFGTLKEANPCHAPAGTPAGGQFCSLGHASSAKDPTPPELVEYATQLETLLPALKATIASLRANAKTQAERDLAPLIAYGEQRSQRYLDDHGTTASKYQQGPGEYIPERSALHEKVIREVVEGKPTGLSQPVAVIIGGMTGSGKTTSVMQDLSLTDKVYINSDDFKAALPEYEGWNASALHEESSHIADKAFEVALQRRQHIVLDSAMRSLGGVDYESASGDGASVAARIKRLRKAGYRVEVRFVDIDIDTSVERMLLRYARKEASTRDGRYVPIGYIRANADEQYGTVPRRTFEAIKPYVDAYVHVDNRGKRRKVIDAFGTLAL